MNKYIVVLALETLLDQIIDTGELPSNKITIEEVQETYDFWRKEQLK